MMRIAILLVGLARTFKQTHESLFNLINRYPEHQFDIFVTTWNIKGNVSKEKTIHKVNLARQVWMNDQELMLEDDLDLIKKIYQPKFFRVINYANFRSATQNSMDKFITRLNLEHLRNWVEQSLFGQYYAIEMAVKDLEEHGGNNYDLVIKTRFDLSYDIGSQGINWNEIRRQADFGKIISMKEWIPKGISDQLLIGSMNTIKKYAELYSRLPEVKSMDLDKIRLVSFYLPDLYIHYDAYKDGMNFQEFFRGKSAEIRKNLLDFLEQGGQFMTPIIAERFLLYFLKEMQGIDVHVEEFIELMIVRDNISRKANAMSYFVVNGNQVSQRGEPDQ